MSENTEIETTRLSDPRLRYIVPVIIVLGLILLVLALVASFGGQNNTSGLKPFRPTRTPLDNGVTGDVLVLSFVDINGAPNEYENQRIRVTGDKVTILPANCRLYTGPVFSWGLIADGLQLNVLGFEDLVEKLPDGLTMTVEGVWRQYNGSFGCGKEPEDGVAWYLQAERIISPNPLPVGNSPLFATVQVPLGATNPATGNIPLITGTPETAVTTQPGIGITPLPTNTLLPNTTPLPPITATAFPTATSDPSVPTVLPSATRLPGITPTATLQPGSTATTTPIPNGTATPTATAGATQTPIPTVPGLATQTPVPTIPGYGGPVTPYPTLDPYS